MNRFHIRCALLTAACLVGASAARAQQAGMHYYFFSAGDTEFSFQDASGTPSLHETRTFHRMRCFANGHCGAGDVQTDVDVVLGSVRARSQVTTGADAGGPAPFMFASADNSNELDFANLTAADVVFVDTADPASTRSVDIFVHVNVAAYVHLSGDNTCGTGNRDGTVGCEVRLGNGVIQVSYAIRHDALSFNTMPPDWLPDGMPHPVRLGPFNVPLLTPLAFRISSTAAADAVLCTPVGFAISTETDVLTDTTLTPGEAVFEAPAGIIGDSTLMRIDDNIFLGSPQPPCTADFNNDGSVGSQDFFDFLAAFFGNVPSADVNHDGTINSQDIFDFLAAFFIGC